MTDKLKFAVIGVGIMGSSHVRDITHSEDIALAAICDIDAQRAQAAADNREPFRSERLGQIQRARKLVGLHTNQADQQLGSWLAPAQHHPLHKFPTDGQIEHAGLREGDHAFS